MCPLKYKELPTGLSTNHQRHYDRLAISYENATDLARSIIRTPWCQYVSQENEIKRTRRRHSPATPLIIIMLLRASPQLQSHWTKKEVYIDVKKDDLLSLYTNWAVSMAVTYCHIGYGLIYTREGGIQGQWMSLLNSALIHRSNRSLQLSVQVPLSSKKVQAWNECSVERAISLKS